MKDNKIIIFTFSLYAFVLICCIYFMYELYNREKARTRPQSPKFICENIKAAIRMYKANTGQLPPNIDALVGKYLIKKPYTPWGLPYALDTIEHQINYFDFNNCKKSIKYY